MTGRAGPPGRPSAGTASRDICVASSRERVRAGRLPVTGDRRWFRSRGADVPGDGPGDPLEEHESPGEGVHFLVAEGARDRARELPDPVAAIVV
jgi:hypothetical protein